MNSTVKIILALALPAFFAGCVGVGPNTQQDAVAGGVLGAIAGAILGHNSPGRDALGGAIMGGTAGAIAGGTLGNSVDNQQGTLYGAPQTAMTTTQRVASVPPPPSSSPTDVVTPSPSPDAVWIPGYWVYNGASYIWTAGHWEVPPANCHTYVAPYWAYQNGGYVFVPGYWR